MGKTTLIKRIFFKNPEKFYGFWTEEIRENGRRVGFKVITTWGREGILAHIRFKSNYMVGKYAVNVSGFENLVLSNLRNPPTDKILLLDEIGKMELFSKDFAEILKKLIFLENYDILATIPLKDVHPLIKKIKERFKVIYLTLENREEVFKELSSFF